MRPLLHPVLVNGRTGDPALYIETLFEKRAILIDLGDISRLPPRKIQRLEGVFVSHAHIDHFIGFDHLLRVMAGRQKTIAFYGPRGFIDQVYHKLQAYRWNLVDQFASDSAEERRLYASVDAGFIGQNVYLFWRLGGTCHCLSRSRRLREACADVAPARSAVRHIRADRRVCPRVKIYKKLQSGRIKFNLPRVRPRSSVGFRRRYLVRSALHLTLGSNGTLCSPSGPCHRPCRRSA